MIPRIDIEVAADAYGEDALGPLFATPLVIETDAEREDREEREFEAQAYEDWVMSYRAWEHEWWITQESGDTAAGIATGEES